MSKTYADECLARTLTGSNEDLDQLLDYDVPELARRLKLACAMLRHVAFSFDVRIPSLLADELEAPLGDK